ncbi:MAG: branched-chain amino acid ABC transporter substrate-binding protein [Phycisphaerales bacterium]|nr:branched-chain amino acid ABC transporter substrate-binding protein [Phycisphaerales bacterium]
MKAAISIGLGTVGWFCLGSAVSLLGGCGNDSPANAREASPAPAANPKIIKIVSSLPRTGSANAQTTTLVNGIKMAIDEVGGKVGEFTIVYEDWDDASPQRGNWDPAVETANANKAVSDPDVMAYIGTYNSGAAKMSMPILNRANLVMVSPANTAVELTKPGLGEAHEPMAYRPSGKVNYVRVVPADDIQGSVAADWAKELGVKRAFVLHDREVYGKGIAEIFRRRAKEAGVEIVGFEGIDAKAPNYRSLVTKIKEQNPELVYFGGTTQSNAGQVAKDLVSGGLNVKFMVPDGCFENAFIDGAGAANVNERAFITFGGVPPEKLTGKGAEFYENYKSTYGSEPEGYAVYGYEAAKVALAGITKAGKKDREAIRQAIVSIKDFDGALGKWSFDENGDTTLKTMSGNTVKNGKFAFVKVLGQ